MRQYIIQRGKKYLQSILDGQPLEWTYDKQDACRFKAEGKIYAIQLARSCGGRVVDCATAPSVGRSEV